VSEQPSEPNERASDAFDRLVGNLANAGVTTFVTQATGSPESGAVIGAMAAPLGEELSYFLRKLIDVKERRGRALIQSAAIQAEMPPGSFLEAIITNPSKIELLARALDAANRSSSLLKVALLANVLASGALQDDGATVDDQLLSIDALSQIDTPHLRMLVVLLERSPVWWPDPADRRRLVWAWPASRIVEKDPGLRQAFPAVAARLQSLGMVAPIRHRDDGLWTLTSFGRICLAALSVQGADEVGTRAVSGHVD
jgi:hypothetical protein